MAVITIQLPKKLHQKLLQVAQNESEFVLEAIKEKINKTSNKHLEKLLIEGYQATYQEDLEITKDFEKSKSQSNQNH